MTENQRSTKNESITMMVMTAAVMMLNIIGVIIAYAAWKIYGKESEFVKKNGLKLIDFYISFVIYEFAILLLVCIVKQAAYLIPAMSIIYLITFIIAIIQYYRHKEFKYPLSFKIIEKLKTKSVENLKK
ncbi:MULTISPECIES: DUF4870 domain-containing protein [Paraclostridium]|uniref:DUF4870 domain-containing protein n=3 Tax=Paraclostridium bifermentans TaxID=1490 RepID=A0A1X2JLM9_PARBF|nr:MULTISPECIES: DUF4870 domain-containing protein [Paraclostridium]KGJ49367.1 hypothetical protein KD33_08685 [Clostridium sp. NCR]MCU9809827.1 DUF4870 domain-containing protein [Paraclostridium sp. AKS46]MDV8114505.1 DUF4870 domain-containing protein [Bacillus sp. BAU-SS-2023]EQK40312.1 tic20-like family protein [[Clostridium] bifermentans ATCC 19299] [Paraclostridium bifermentans ATCC 19299]EQK43095.1 tic20-like family protein [[Clostridium] bifermentans ATCC 638] [Paraclostridium biferment